ncbi:molybdopterin-dependent oxidoreductase [Campylobacter sp. VicNov18]|nr:molybdopterin-dependent oxidoreductase [Campylobacter bilis]
MLNVNENIKLTRRSFLKMAMLSSLASPLLARNETLREASAEELKEAYEGSKKVKTVCTACSVGCGIIAEVQNGVWVRQEIAQDHPISLGGHCCKGSDMIDMVRSHVRLKYPMKKEKGVWKRISYEQALDEIGEKLANYRKENPESVMFLGSAKMSNEQAYYVRKFAAFFGTNNIDHQARI